MTTLNNNQSNNESPIKLAELLGTKVIGKLDIPIVNDVLEPVKNREFLIVGINGNKEGNTVKNYSLMIEDVESKNYIDISENQLEEHFNRA